MEHADGVSESCVSRARKNKLRKPQLSNPAQALKRPCLNDTPKRAFELIRSEFDKIMKGVADALFPCGAKHVSAIASLSTMNNKVSDVVRGTVGLLASTCSSAAGTTIAAESANTN